MAHTCSSWVAERSRDARRGAAPRLIPLSLVEVRSRALFEVRQCHGLAIGLCYRLSIQYKAQYNILAIPLTHSERTERAADQGSVAPPFLRGASLCAVSVSVSLGPHPALPLLHTTQSSGTHCLALARE